MKYAITNGIIFLETPHAEEEIEVLNSFNQQILHSIFVSIAETRIYSRHMNAASMSVYYSPRHLLQCAKARLKKY